MKSLTLAFVHMLSVAAMTCVPASGQEDVLNITGTVLDMANHPVPGTSVSLIATDTGRAVSAVLSDKAGHFVISGVPLQPYLLKLEQEGFESKTVPLDVSVPPVRFAGPLTFQMVPLKETQNSGATDSYIGCIERLQLPEYPALAKHARIQGTVTASISLPSPGSSPNITTEYSGPLDGRKVGGLLSVPVEDAIHRAKFRQGCNGKQVTLIFHFELLGDPSARPSQSVSFGSPNEFWISAVPPMFQP